MIFRVITNKIILIEKRVGNLAKNFFVSLLLLLEICDEYFLCNLAVRSTLKVDHCVLHERCDCGFEISTGSVDISPADKTQKIVNVAVYYSSC